MRHLVLRGGVAVALASAVPGLAFAHAHMAESAPAAGSTITAAPSEVSMHFTEDVEPRFSNIEVFDPSGHSVTSGPAHLVEGDGDHLAVPVRKLGAGTYKVKWHATATDTHKTQGDWVFTVAP